MPSWAISRKRKKGSRKKEEKQKKEVTSSVNSDNSGRQRHTGPGEYLCRECCKLLKDCEYDGDHPL